MPHSIHLNPTSTIECYRSKIARTLMMVCAVWIVLYLLAPPARPCTTPSGAVASPGSSSGNFFTNFVQGFPSTYEIPISFNAPSGLPGDLNAGYAELYYSLYNHIMSWQAAGNCPIEVVLAGTFPDVRYLSVVDNDDHLAGTEHIADLGLDPVGWTGTSGTYFTYENPFVVGLDQSPGTLGGVTGGSLPYTSGQYWLTPLSLGTVPGGSVTPGCTISPAESDNLLDLSWRHLSMQWNTTVSTSYPSVPTLTAVSLPSHLPDTPQHQQQTSNLLTTAGWNMGGSALVRNYLLPQLSCTGSPGTGSSGTLSCTQSMPFSANPVYLFVRDTQTGCAYTASAINTYLLQTSSSGPGYNNAVVSTVNPATSSFPANWSNATQTTAHVQVANYTPEACYANGAAGNGNLVAWARSPEYGGQPGPDDAYIGGAVSSSFLGNLTSGHFLLLQFALPSTPNTPCLKNGNPVYNCDLSGNEQLRYMSLTFLQPQGSPPAGAVVADPDNVTGQTSNLPLSLISIADSALAAATVSWNGFNLVNLVINTASNGLPSWLLESNGTPITQGVSPVLIDRNSNGDYDSYGLWVVNASLGGGVTVPYVVLDLSRFVGTSGTTALNSNGTAVTVPAFTTSQDLLIEMRTTLPNTSSGYSFPCSGAAVPYSTAEYTSLGGGGMMGPFAPYVISWAPGNSPVNYPNPNLPTTTQYCGDPGTAGPLLTNPIGNGTQGDFPRQYWPTGSNTGAANLTLNCPTSPSSSTSTPSIQYVSTQAPNAVDYTGGPTNCTTPTTCNQVILQSTERTEMPGGASWTPGIPLTIVGSGFGYFAYAASGQPFNASLPYASMGSAPPQIYIGYCPHGSYQCTPSTGITWDTTNTSCQVYINNWYDTSISLVLATTDDVQNIYQSQSPLLAGTYLSPLSDLTFDTLSAASGCQMTANDYLYFTITNPQSGNSNPTGLNQWFNAKILAATTTPTN